MKAGEKRKCQICGKEFSIIDKGWTRKYCYECSPKEGKDMSHDKAILIKHHAIKKALVEKKGGKCEICGYNKCIDALQFHHLDPSEKEFGIAATHRNFDELVKEAEKCILVCANCHTELHYNERVSPRG